MCKTCSHTGEKVPPAAPSARSGREIPSEMQPEIVPSEKETKIGGLAVLRA